MLKFFPRIVLQLEMVPTFLNYDLFSFFEQLFSSLIDSIAEKVSKKNASARKASPKNFLLERLPQGKLLPTPHFLSLFSITTEGKIPPINCPRGNPFPQRTTPKE